MCGLLEADTSWLSPDALARMRSHFASARPYAPRLLALDKAFAGVDNTGRGELMGLTASSTLTCS